MENHALHSGSIVENYKIIKKLGQGGFGITYLVKDIKDNKLYVLKELFLAKGCSRGSNNNVIIDAKHKDLFEYSKKRFIDEAVLLEGIKYYSIVRVYKHFYKNSTAYYLMEYIDGISLMQLVEEKGTLNKDEVIEYIFPILEAVKVMHKNNLWHRDIKPLNIMIDKINNRSVLIDFGAVKVINKQRFGLIDDTSLYIAYSDFFSPPEQHPQFSKGVETDHRSDVYSIGATIYYLFTGKPTNFNSKNFENELLTTNIPKEFQQVILKSTKSRKEERFDNIEQIQKVLIPDTEPFLSNENTVKTSLFTPFTDTIIITIIATIIAFIASDNNKLLIASIVFIVGLIVSFNKKNKASRNISKKGNIKLIIKSNTEELEFFLENKKSYTLGRDFSCDIVIPSKLTHVSRKHLKININNDIITINELKTTQGTYLNGQKLKPNQEYSWEEEKELILVNGDCILLWKKLNKENKQ